ncbi:hypothetical protein LJR129_002195 [Acidovorax sp. LjRoot129]|uniref:hypothetical protein n=1 Tax=Acidovorax sp. LjRoot129 TaxID=3342260 RepID=UPI003ECC7653
MAIWLIPRSESDTVIRKHRVLLAGIAISVGCIAQYAYANPGVAACALSDIDLADHTLTEHERLRVEGGLRISRFYGTPQATPIVVFWDRSTWLGKLNLNEYASTHMLGTRVCVFVGPKGRSVDVVAHELVHAEVFERVGPWARATQLPVWFDEGLAMQVDYRDAYDLPENFDTSYVRTLASPAAFYTAAEGALTTNYGSAKVEVARWVAGVGAKSVFAQLARLRNGEPFASIDTP